MRAAKVDQNQPAIVSVMRAAGASVQPLHTVGQGVPDLLCAVSGITFLVEVKDGSKPPNKQQLTADQKEWHAAWKAPVHIVKNVEQAFDLVQKMKGQS